MCLPASASLHGRTMVSIKLTGENDGETFKVIEGDLIMLDTGGNEITGKNAKKYILKQITVTG